MKQINKLVCMCLQWADRSAVAILFPCQDDGNTVCQVVCPCLSIYGFILVIVCLWCWCQALFPVCPDNPTVSHLFMHPLCLCLCLYLLSSFCSVFVGSSLYNVARFPVPLSSWHNQLGCEVIDVRTSVIICRLYPI